MEQDNSEQNLLLDLHLFQHLEQKISNKNHNCHLILLLL